MRMTFVLVSGLLHLVITNLFQETNISQIPCWKEKEGMQTLMPVLAQGTGIDEMGTQSFQSSLFLGESSLFLMVTVKSRKQP